MNARALMCTIALFGSTLAQADSVTISSGNSSLKINRDDPTTPIDASGSWQFLRAFEWKIGASTVLVYPGLPSAWLDIGHIHMGGHVQSNQVHAQGPLFGYGDSEMSGSALGGAVYAVHGGSLRCRTSRITEKLDFVNRTGAPLKVTLSGMGYKPDPASTSHPVVPDLTGWTITGTSTYYTQGKDAALSIHDVTAGFGPVLVRKVSSFTGFNSLNRVKITLDSNATLTMVTELNISPTVAPSPICNLNVRPLPPIFHP